MAKIEDSTKVDLELRNTLIIAVELIKLRASIGNWRISDEKAFEEAIKTGKMVEKNLRLS